MLVVIFILLALGIILVIMSFYSESLKLSAGIRKEIKEDVAIYNDDLVKKPFAISVPFLALNRFILFKLGRQKLNNDLFAADLSMMPEDFLALKEISIIILLAAIFLVMKPFSPLAAVIGIALGLVLPDIYLKIKIKKRKRLIVHFLPDAIDLLTLCVQGGLDFMTGLNWVVKRTKINPLIREFYLVIHEVRMGKTRQDAFRAMGKRINIPEVFSFVNTIIHADRMGTPISEVLKILSEDARRRRFQRGERMALEAPIKMLFPLIFFILPAVAIIVGAPVLLQFLQGGGTTLKF